MKLNDTFTGVPVIDLLCHRALVCSNTHSVFLLETPPEDWDTSYMNGSGEGSDAQYFYLEIT